MPGFALSSPPTDNGMYNMPPCDLWRRRGTCDGHPGSDAPTTAARATRSVSRCGDCGDVYNTRLVHSCNTRTHGSTHRVSQHSQTHEPSATRASLSSPCLTIQNPHTPQHAPSSPSASRGPSFPSTPSCWGLLIESCMHPWPRISYFLGMCSVEVEDDIVRRGLAIGPEHGSRCGDCVDDGFAIGPEHGSRCGDCVDDGGLWCSFGSH